MLECVRLDPAAAGSDVLAGRYDSPDLILRRQLLQPVYFCLLLFSSFFFWGVHGPMRNGRAVRPGSGVARLDVAQHVDHEDFEAFYTFLLPGKVSRALLPLFAF